MSTMDDFAEELRALEAENKSIRDAYQAGLITYGDYLTRMNLVVSKMTSLSQRRHAAALGMEHSTVKAQRAAVELSALCAIDKVFAAYGQPTNTDLASELATAVAMEVYPPVYGEVLPYTT